MIVTVRPEPVESHELAPHKTPWNQAASVAVKTKELPGQLLLNLTLQTSRL